MGLKYQRRYIDIPTEFDRVTLYGRVSVRNPSRVGRLVWLAVPALAACSVASNSPSLPFTANGGTARTASIARIHPLSYYGCPAFGPGAYNGVVTGTAIDRNSASYIKSVIGAGDGGGFYAATGAEKVNLADRRTPRRTVHPRVKYHKFPVPYPWGTSFYIEPLRDEHAMVVLTGTCHLYESYGTTFQQSILSGYSGANWDLSKSFVPLPPGSPSSMASGLSLFAGMVRWEDYQSGTIAHALNWSGLAGSAAQFKFVRPASDTDWLPYQGKSSYQMPYGARLRLRASFDTTGWGPEATMVATAMKAYGVYLSDTNSMGNELYFANAADGTNPWDTEDLSSLSQITLRDFDVLKLKKIQTVPGH